MNGFVFASLLFQTIINQVSESFGNHQVAPLQQGGCDEVTFPFLLLLIILRLGFFLRSLKTLGKSVYLFWFTRELSLFQKKKAAEDAISAAFLYFGEGLSLTIRESGCFSKKRVLTQFLK